MSSGIDQIFSQNIRNALKSANAPGLLNPIATISDVSTGSGSNLIAFFHTTSTALADNSDYYITAGTALGATKNSSVKMPIPEGTLLGYSIVSYVGGTFGTSEAAEVYFDWNDGLNSELLSNSVLYNSRNNKVVGLKNVATQESYGWIRIETPLSYATNPTATKTIVILRFEI